jgi:hypothetical protein
VGDLRALQGRVAVDGFLHGESCLLEVHAEQVADVALVVNHQNRRGHDLFERLR